MSASPPSIAISARRRISRPLWRARRGQGRVRRRMSEHVSTAASWRRRSGSARAQRHDLAQPRGRRDHREGRRRRWPRRAPRGAVGHMARRQRLPTAGGARGATMYVSLEPCAHRGRGGPCADAIIAAGVARVVAAMADPDPRVPREGVLRDCARRASTSRPGFCAEEARARPRGTSLAP